MNIQEHGNDGNKDAVPNQRICIAGNKAAQNRGEAPNKNNEMKEQIMFIYTFEHLCFYLKFVLSPFKWKPEDNWKR